MGRKHGRKVWQTAVTFVRKAMFFCRHMFEKKIEFDETPRVLMTRIALEKMWHYVDIAHTEVSWLGTVVRHGHDFLIEDVFLAKQEVSMASVELTTEGLAEFAEELFASRPNDGMEIVNKLCFWGHSHVNMGTSASGPDDAQMETFRESGHPFFIRGILNKMGRMEFTIYLYDLGVKINDAEWRVCEPVDENLREEIEAEFKEKVTTKTYTYTPGRYIPGEFASSIVDREFGLPSPATKVEVTYGGGSEVKLGED